MTVLNLSILAQHIGKRLDGTGNSFTKGATLGIRMDPTNSPGYTQIMAVFEFDTTT